VVTCRARIRTGGRKSPATQCDPEIINCRSCTFPCKYYTLYRH